MIPETLIIEQHRRRERERAWEPIPLHAPTPMPHRPERGDDRDEQQRDGETGRGVIIIDISDYSETRL